MTFGGQEDKMITRRGGRAERKEIREFDREASGGGRFLNDCARYRTIDYNLVQ